MNIKKSLCVALVLLMTTNLLCASTQSQPAISPVTSMVYLAGALGLGLFLGFILRSSFSNESSSVIVPSSQNCALEKVKKNEQDEIERLEAQHVLELEIKQIDIDRRDKRIKKLKTELKDGEVGLQRYLSLVEQNMQKNKIKIEKLREELKRYQAENVQYAGKIEDGEKELGELQEKFDQAEKERKKLQERLRLERVNFNKDIEQLQEQNKDLLQHKKDLDVLVHVFGLDR